MCTRNDDQVDDNGAYFCRGALQVLARMKGASVVATYIEPPPLSGQRSSEVCRGPLIKPCIDMNQVMNFIPELRLDCTSETAEVRRLLATLKFRLAMKIGSLVGSSISVLHCRNISEEAETFLRDFQTKASDQNKMAALKACIKLCEIKLLPQLKLRPNAAEILVGLKESESNLESQGGMVALTRKVPDLILINNGDVTDRLISSELRTLLGFTVEDPCMDAFKKGRDLFKKMLKQNPEDLLSNKPLELAYAWAIASKMHGYSPWAHIPSR